MTGPTISGFDDQAQQLRTRWAQARGGKTRGNAPPGAAAGQGGRPSATVAQAPAAASGAPDAMDPGIPGVPPIFPAVTGAPAAPVANAWRAAPPPGGTPGQVGPTPGSLDASVAKFQGFAREGVKGYSDIASQDFTKNVGNLLGDLNGIGGLRSGAVVQGVNDLTTNFARQIGDYSSMATQGAISGAQTEYDREIERKKRDEADARARRGSFLHGVGTLLGGALSLVPNPAAQVASKVVTHF